MRNSPVKSGTGGLLCWVWRGRSAYFPAFFLYGKTSSATADSGPWLKRVPHRICPGGDRKLRVAPLHTRFPGTSFQKSRKICKTVIWLAFEQPGVLYKRHPKGFGVVLMATCLTERPS